MNRLFRKVAERILLMPSVKRQFLKAGVFYKMYPLEALPDNDFRAADTRRSDAVPNLEVGNIVSLQDSDAKALETIAQRVQREGVLITEVGSWTGKSTSILAKTVATCHGTVFAVDHWRGNVGVWNYDITKAYDIYSIFRRNMIWLGLWDIVHPLVMDSQMASRIFADGILDLVFIDGDHRHEYIKKDIVSWLPKLKDGGILSGHDCEGYYTQYPEEVRRTINEHLGDDYISGLCHPGVVRALYDCFQDKHLIMPDSVIWYYVKQAEDGK